MAIFVFRFQLAFHYHLGRYTGVIGTYLPEGVIPLHAVIADQCVHDRVLESMAHMQAPGHIGRRDHDAVRLLTPSRGEVITLFPGFVPALLDGVGVIGFIHGIVVVSAMD